jgi:hypothetical protein
MMAQRAGRIMCPRCGANNFDTVTSCWKCGAPVGAAGAQPMPSQLQPPMPAPVSQPAMGMPPSQQSPMAYPQERMPAPVAYSAPQPTGDSGVAKRAALALGLTIPFVGLPVGWVFMMIEDRNKQAIGRWCAMWSMIGLVLHLFVTWFLIQQSVPFMLQLLGPVAKAMSHQNGGGIEGLPGGGGP